MNTMRNEQAKLVNSLANQSVSELGGAASVLFRQKRDHIHLDNLLNRLEQTRPEEQPTLLIEIYRLVFPHAFAEEAVLWPAIRRLLADGNELTLKVEVEHQEINELVTRLESLDVRSPERQQVLERVIELLRTDVRDEEDVLLPRLQGKLSFPQLRRLGLAWEAVRRMAPTRPHPIVSRRPPGNVLSALPLSILDRSRDFAEARVYRGVGAFAPPLRALSSALRRASRVVERLPGMKSGEHPATRVEGSSMGRYGAAIVGIAAVSVVYLLAKRRRRSLPSH